jgi:O-antigen/teichoic acid export membrane protein
MRRLLTNAAVLTVSNVISRALLFVGLALLARRISVADFGSVSVATAWGGAAFVACEWGFDIRALQAYARRPHRVGALLADVIVLRLLLSAIGFAAFFLLGLYLGQVGSLILGLVIGSYVLSALAKSMRIPFIAAGRGSAEAKLATFERVSGFGLLLVGLVLIENVSRHVWIYGASLMLAALATTVLSFVAVTRNWPLRWRPNVRRWRTLLFSATPMGVNALAVWAYYRANLLILSKLEGAHSAGVFGAISLITMAFGIAAQSFVLTLAPRIARIANFGERDGEALIVLIRYVGYGGVLCAISLSVAAPLTVSVLFGSQYAAGVDVLRILSLHVFFLLTTPLVAVTLRMHGAPADMARFAIYGALVSIFTGLALIHVLGITGAALGTLLGEATVFVLCVQRFAKLTNTTRLGRKLRLTWPLLSSAALCALGLVSQSLQLLGAALLAGVLAYEWRMSEVRRTLVYFGAPANDE